MWVEKMWVEIYSSELLSAFDTHKKHEAAAPPPPFVVGPGPVVAEPV
jgi:hypothetical protein